MEISIPTLLRIKPNAVYKLGKYLRKENFCNIALFYGEGMKEILAEKITISFESSEIRIIHEEIVTNNQIETLFNSSFSIPSNVDAIVAIGGGKVIDYSKYVAFIMQIPIISVPTTISNDGFASPVSSLIVNGRRKSLKAKIPFGVIIDTDIISNSPKRYSYSGIGDMISKFTAIYDWKLSYHKTGEPVNDFAVLISSNSVQNMVNYHNKDISDPEFIKLVCGCLVMSGVSMEVSKSSRPASGSEHLISHAYDKISKNPSLHGIQVGIATYLVAWLQENPNLDIVKNVLDVTGFFNHVRENPLNKAELIESIRYATNIKENYYTILSEKGNVEKLVDFVETDPFINQFLK
jgi:glycerol-1-phosphate dehydrogenase [NAD(P)+]